MSSLYQKLIVGDEVEVLIPAPKVVNSNGNLFNKTDQFAAAFALIGGLDQDVFLDILTFVETVGKLELFKIMGNAISNPDDMWANVDSFRKRNPVELLELLSGSSNFGKSNSFKAIGVELYNTGVAELDLGFDSEWNTDDQSSNVQKILSNQQHVKSAALREKKNSITNAVKAVVDVLPMRHAVSSSLKARYDKVVDMVDDFDQGTFEYGIKDIKYPKESGVALPHTLKPNQWLVRALKNLFGAITGESAGIAVKIHGKVNISVADKPGDAIYFSDSENSPYNLECHPSWTVPSDGLDDDWEWRTMETEMRKKVQLDYADFPMLERDRIVDSGLRDYLASYEMVDIRHTTMSFMFFKDGVPYFKFFKDGTSSLEQVSENDQFLHVVSINVVDGVSNSDYVKILLPDTSSVLLLPVSFWSVLGIKSFHRSEGIVIKSGDIQSMRNLTLFYQLSHTMAFMRSLDGGIPYNFHSHSEKLEAMATTPRANRELFENGSSPGQRVSLIRALSKITSGGSFGLVVGAERSKVGNRTTRDINKNSGFRKVADVDKFDESEIKVDFSKLFGPKSDDEQVQADDFAKEMGLYDDD